MTNTRTNTRRLYGAGTGACLSGVFDLVELLINLVLGLVIIRIIGAAGAQRI